VRRKVGTLRPARLIEDGDDTTDVVYFYLKVNGRFGRGFVYSMIKTKAGGSGGGEVAYTSLSLFLNPSGSRNVAQRHD
jgi:hypothetical protein